MISLKSLTKKRKKSIYIAYKTEIVTQTVHVKLKTWEQDGIVSF